MADKKDAETKEETTSEEKHHDIDTSISNNLDQPPKSKVCRKLDFDSDQKEVRDLLALSDEDLDIHRRKGIEKWNFDFENEIPLEGDWQWERVPVEPPEAKEVVCAMEKQHHDNRTV